MRCAAAVALFVGLLAASAPAARAQEDYATLIREALVEYNAGNWEEAHLLFKRAHAIRPSARTLRGMGLANYERRSYVAAIRDLEASLSSSESPLSADQRATTERALARARQYAAIYTLEVPAGVAVLIVDGQRIALPEDRRVSLDPGKHELSVKTESGETIERDIEAGARVRGGQPRRGGVCERGGTLGSRGPSRGERWRPALDVDRRRRDGAVRRRDRRLRPARERGERRVREAS